MTDLTNEERAKRAETTLKLYEVLYDPNEGNRTAAVDFLADLLHFHGLDDYLAIFESALNHFKAEVAEHQDKGTK